MPMSACTPGTRAQLITQTGVPQAAAQLPAHLADGALQPALPVLHAGGGRGPVTLQGAPHVRRDPAPGAPCA